MYLTRTGVASINIKKITMAVPTLTIVQYAASFASGVLAFSQVIAEVSALRPEEGEYYATIFLDELDDEAMGRRFPSRRCAGSCSGRCKIRSRRAKA